MRGEIQPGSVVVATRDQVSTDLGDEVAILDLGAGEYFGLDEVGKRVWELVQQPITAAEIRDALLRDYDVEPQRCERDVLALLSDMANEGLIEVRDEGSA